MNIAKLTSSALLTLSSLGLLAGPLSSPAHAAIPTMVVDVAGASPRWTELPFRPGGGTLWGYRSDLEISASALVGGVWSPQSNSVYVYSPGASL